VAEGAPLLREYAGKTCIEGSNPSGSAKTVELGSACSAQERAVKRLRWQHPYRVPSLPGADFKPIG
jgi:hypothetical protein